MLAGLLAACPFAVTLAVSAFVPMFVPRYLAVAIPGLALLCAGVVQLRHGWRAVVAIGLFVATCVPGLRSWYVQTQRDDYRSAAALVAENGGPDDVVIVYPRFGMSAFAYYDTEHHLVGPRKALRPGWLERSAVAWLVLHDGTRRDATAAALRRRMSTLYRSVRSWHPHGLIVIRYGRTGSP
jgi:hypothetical protein